ncbi:FlgO family outer membrane protein [Pseudoalteromonas denitrificans]|jgi:TolB-like protein|uniref:FlgO domain-containing protein n=1 Tax=Pseudoalteromonas denitrificans DSM 6059 TaxID=1123010 RepID=A0A1I1HNN7_9GAMM|nr:FlgO family outer membrane protein [Pseudoalteromonas denitrificans]SFC25729.1 hypothetical protein SAMN02745724_01284 [Pseudoalteromonas denitrificans DSM 6059]
MQKLITPFLLLILSGCSNFNSGLELPETTRLCLTPKGVYHKCGSDQALEANTIKRKKIYASPESNNSGTQPSYSIKHHKKLEEYIEQMVMDMQYSLSRYYINEPIAVASFVELDTDLSITNQLGLELSESFIAELMKANFPLVEHRVTGEIMLTQDGDFVLSRNPHQVKSLQKIGYVMSGTLLKRHNGILVNARIVGLKNNQILASSSKLIPKMILNGY